VIGLRCQTMLLLTIAFIAEAADDAPVVRVLPMVPVDGSTKTLLDRVLPASQEFILEVASPDEGIYTSGALDLWASENCAEPSGPQQYTLALVPTGEPPNRTLRAKLPPLQIRQNYCLRISRNVALTEAQAQALESFFLGKLRKYLTLAGNEPPRPPSVELFAATMAEAAAEMGFRGDAKEASRAIYAFFARTDAPAAYKSYQLASADLLLERTLGREIDRQMSQVVEEAEKLPHLEQGNATGSPGDRAVLKRFRNNPFDDTGNTWDAVEQILDRLEALGRAENVTEWRNILERVHRLSVAQSEHRTRLKAKIKQEKDALGQLEAKVNKAVEGAGKSIPASVLRQPLSAVTIKTEPGSSTTPSAGNYASIDLGVAVAFATSGGTGNPWFLPYLGINLYFAPVERMVPFDRLAGTWCQRYLAQRFSLTGGFTLSSPGIPGRTVGTLLFGKYPLVAAGYRVSQYVRVTVGVVFYELSSRNPVLSSASVAVAPYGGISLDVDMIHFIVNGISAFKWRVLMCSVTLEPPHAVSAGVPFDIFVDVEGASPGAKVTVELKHMSGPPCDCEGYKVVIQTGATGEGDDSISNVRCDQEGDVIMGGTASEANGLPCPVTPAQFSVVKSLT